MTPDEHAALLRQLTDLEAKFAAAPPLAAGARHRPAAAARQERQALVEIALLCKRALGSPPFTCPHDLYLLDIARLCKRALEREAP
jgi:hypothetical protein